MKPIFRAKTLLLFLLLAFMQIVQSCNSRNDTSCSSKQVTCPSFQDSLAEQWIPYKLNQQIIFTSANTKNDTITFRNVDKTQSYQETIGASNSSCEATATWGNSYNTKPFSDTIVNFFISQSNDQYNINSPTYTFTRIQFHTLFLSGYTYCDTGLVILRAGEANWPSNQYVTLFSKKLTLGSKNFENVQSFEYDTTFIKKGFFVAPNTIYKFYVAKNIGLIAYKRYPDNKLWVKQ